MGVSSADLLALAGRLEAAFAPADVAFLAAGDRLGRAALLLQGVAESFGALRLALEGEAVRDAAARLADAAHAMGALTDQLCAESGALDGLGAALHEVGLRIAALSRVNEALGVLALNSAIASGALEVEAPDVAAFQAELRRLTDSAVATVRQFGLLHAEALHDLEGVAADQAGFVRQQAPRLRELAARIGAGLAAIAARRQKAGEAAAQMERRGQSIVGAVANAVLALQVGDATRQRIEHVADALRQLGSGLDGAALRWCEGLDPYLCDGLTGRAMALEAAQLEDTAEVLSTEGASIADALGRLRTDAEAMVELGVTLFGGEGSEGASFLSTLDQDLNAATRLLAEAASQRRALDDAIARADGRMRSLGRELEAIRDLEVNLRLAGLNAVLRCARLGDKGRAMAAITLELRACARQMAERVAALGSASDASLAASAAIRTGDGARLAQGLDAMMGGLRASLGELGEAGRAMDTAIARLRDEGGEVVRTLGGMVDGIGAVTALAGDLGAAAEELGRLRVGCPQAGARLLKQRLGLVHAVPYTMAAERVIARAHGADMPDPGPETAGTEMEDVFF